MIKSLFIKNFTIIEEMFIEFHPGLTVITGETGSGKSIILEAIAVASGKKASKVMVKSGAKNSVIDLGFSKDSYRRIISNSGRSKSYINDAPVSTTKLFKEFEYKIDFHGQHDQQVILQKDNHINYLDYFCNHQHKVIEIGNVFRDLEKYEKQLFQLKKNISLNEQKKELLEFQLNEIELADIQVEKEVELLNEYKKLNHQEEILNFFNQLQLKLNNQNEGILSDLNSILNNIETLKKYDNDISRFGTLFNSIIVQLQDIDSEINSRLNDDEFDESRLSFIEERIGVLETLKRKYGGSLESVISCRNQIREELDEISSFFKSDIDLNENIIKLRLQYNKLANELSIARNKNKTKLSSLIEHSLISLNMEKARFDIDISQNFIEDSFMTIDKKPVNCFFNGVDQVEFLLSANPGESMKPMTSVASGGEMSRIMLAIKTVFQDQNPVSTLIFDEIDTGISGETAQKVSSHLKKLSKHKQVVCITHLPQIAKIADNHLHVTKNMDDVNTTVESSYIEGDKSKRIINNLLVGGKVRKHNG